MPLSKLFIVYATFTNFINFKINIFITTFGKQCFLKNTHPLPLKKKYAGPPNLKLPARSLHWWNFSLTIFEKIKKKVNNGTLQEREQAKIGDVRKRNSKLSGKSFSTELGQFVVNLTRL